MSTLENRPAGPAPFVSSAMRVEPGWIDYNGHMNMAYYHVLFDRAVDEAFASVGLGPDYVASRHASFFTAELHTLYLRELTADMAVETSVHLVDHDAKRLHAYLEIRQLAEGWIAATCEMMLLHVDMRSRAVVPFPPDIAAGIVTMRAVHDRLPRPARLGRTIGIPRGTRVSG